ncbi:MAG TPA: DNA mismatch repair endonuclease MutL [Candidatus Kapabacteria bacterium]|nr:DNA mismatch repair endonuclease MutL [Candidatus Kapabacteria bacterium]
MPAHIAVLPEHLASKIRAGEVVQRPESVVKELLENAIDAGATDIHVIVKSAGKSLIQVIDNGSGMNAEDAVVSFGHHATSKIHDLEDLDRIRTLGFRGEALASIAAVAHVELRTRRTSDDLATIVRMEGGELKETTTTAAPVGTSISVKNLFYNTPARRHFLKSDQTESKHCIETVYRTALAYPTIAFRLEMGEDVVVDAAPTDLHGRMAQLFGEQFAASHVPVQEKTDIISIGGFISQPTFSRRTKAEQYLFLNGRYFQSKTLQYAIYSAYEHVLIKGNYPSYVINITLDPKHIDVNVHPQKLEVKFDDEKMVYSMLNAVVKKGLSTYSLIPETTLPGGDLPDDARLRFAQGGRFEPMGDFRVNVATGEISSPSRMPVGERISRNPQPVPTDDAVSMLFSQTPEIETPSKEYHHDSLRKDVAEIGGSIWQLHNKYIVAQIRTGIIIVDQHVAHERVLYEKALDTLSAKLPFSQQLLFPCSIEMSPANIALVRDILPDLQGLGFAIRFFGKNTVVIDAVPQDVRPGNETWVLAELIEQAREYGQMGTPDARDHIAKTYACKAAIKAGDKLTPPEMNSLIDHLFATRMPYVCPHGRPIVIKIALEELDRRFGRPVPGDPMK